VETLVAFDPPQSPLGKGGSKKLFCSLPLPGGGLGRGRVRKPLTSLNPPLVRGEEMSFLVPSPYQGEG
jgi:hypothetical protein